MNIRDFIGQLEDRKVVVQVVNGELKIKGSKSKLDQDLVTQIRSRKTEILEFFTAIASTSPRASNGAPIKRSDEWREYPYSDGKIARLTEQDFEDLVEVFKILYHWQYGHFIP